MRTNAVPAMKARERQASSYAELSRMVKAAGLLHRRRGYYAVRIGTTLLGLGGS
jgi:hypothetical protein